MLLVLALNIACDDTNNLSIDPTDSGTATGSTADSGTTSAQDERPIVEQGTISCTEGSNSSGDIFYVELVATDPQGPDTLASFGSMVTAYDAADAFVYEDAILVCDTRGQCTGSFRDGTFGAVTCVTYDLYSYEATVVDEDDNWSKAFGLTWIAG